ncbi:transcriptional regulator [Halobellus salinus]|uniref:Transcriptional regulator n=1 Tax=Halobellus salinus TaxID=931585 RepID=A0A830E720_9EURY|nr:multiprotein bridging factor aMBF1 [Halobellus salinus]GGI98684.1 transcriptional regulator [Halobellus salinus]SMP05684.1 transcriptional regulator, XRE family [Halobellus salinus]
MPQCEMCGSEQSSLTTVKVEGAELQLCDDCKEFGTEVRTESSSSASTKYSTSSSGGSGSGSGGSAGSGAGGGGSSRRRRDMFDDMDEIVAEYDQRIRTARESRGLSQEDLAKELNEKASLIRKLERGDMLPSDDVRTKLETELEISLIEGDDADDTEWSGDSSTTTTLGDVVKRKD